MNRLVIRNCCAHLLTVTGLLVASVTANADTANYLTNFTKTDNIYTNLNEEYPHSGTGVPGSTIGTPNASFLYNPVTFPTSSGNGTDPTPTAFNATYNLTSNASGQDFTEFGTASFGVPTVSVSVGLSNVTTVALLVGSYNGDNINVNFVGSGSSQAFNAIGVPDFNGGGYTNTCSAILCEQTVYQVTDVGAGGTGNSTTGAYNTYDLVQLTFNLSGDFSGQTLDSIDLTSGGYEGLLLGATAYTASATSAAPEPSSLALFGAALLSGAYLIRRTRRSSN